jgi:hypothetical protein
MQGDRPHQSVTSTDTHYDLSTSPAATSAEARVQSWIHAHGRVVDALSDHLENLSRDFDEPSSDPDVASHSQPLRSLESSMAPALIHQEHAISRPPSLGYAPSPSASESSIASTGLVSRFSGVPFLEDHNGTLAIPTGRTRTPMYECAFWFLSCAYISTHREEWLAHCESHFRGEEPPCSVQYLLCDWSYTASNTDGRIAWNARMEHVASLHTMIGQTLRTSRPGFGLFQHLCLKRLNDDQDYRKLKGKRFELSDSPSNFVATIHTHQLSLATRELTHQSTAIRQDTEHTEHRERPDSWESSSESQELALGEEAPETLAHPYRASLSSTNGRGDSGYSSMPDTVQQSLRVDDDARSVRTMLSDASLVFQPPQERENLISAFVNDLYEDAKFDELLESARDRVIAQLSELLRCFSLRLENGTHLSKENDAKNFIRQQREYVGLSRDHHTNKC